jgi:hypothetical protein
MKPVGRPRLNLPTESKRDYRPPHLPHYIGEKVNEICKRDHIKPEEFWSRAAALYFKQDHERQKAEEKIKKLTQGRSTSK